MALVAAELWYLTGDDAYRRCADAILAAFAGEARRNPFAHATLLEAAALLEHATQLVIVGEPDDPVAAELLAAGAAAALPYPVLHPLRPEAELPPAHPAHGKRPVAGRAAAYVCVGTVCEAPLTNPAALREHLLGRAAAP